MLVFLPGAIMAKVPRLEIIDHTLAWGGSCEPGFHKLIAGSRLFAHVYNTADQSEQMLIPGWPEGYLLEAALDLPNGKTFIATPGLIERLEPTRYLSTANRASEKDLLEHRTPYVDYRHLNTKEFVLHIPQDAVAHTLTFRARYQLADINLESAPIGPILILAPCDRSDTARIVATRIYEARQMFDYRRAINIADSMLAVGLSDASGWELAIGAAVGCYEYEKAVAYLDRMYEDFGVLETPYPTHPPRLNPQGPRDPEIQAAYQEQRAMLLQEKTNNEKQQR
jgi:hypothetical protein